MLSVAPDPGVLGVVVTGTPVVVVVTAVVFVAVRAAGAPVPEAPAGAAIHDAMLTTASATAIERTTDEPDDVPRLIPTLRSTL